jgi:hypothetical protein
MLRSQHPAADFENSFFKPTGTAKIPLSQRVSAKLFIDFRVLGCSAPNTRRLTLKLIGA